MGFWKGREEMTGLSSRAVISSAAQTVIIYLYLLDAEGVNRIVLATYTVSTMLDLWKVAMVLRIRRRRRPAATGEAAADAPAAIERATERFDQVATHTLGVGLAPIVAGWALYALVHYPHSSW